jgi:ElaB/YqjD/DUF883 family membrane-anchored ribosome-binding protein
LFNLPWSVTMTGFSDDGPAGLPSRRANVADTDELQALVDEGRALLDAPAMQWTYEPTPGLAELRGRFVALQKAASQFADLAGVQVRSAARTADDYVRERPWVATMEALALGFVIGWMLSDRR